MNWYKLQLFVIVIVQVSCTQKEKQIDYEGFFTKLWSKKSISWIVEQLQTGQFQLVSIYNQPSPNEDNVWITLRTKNYGTCGLHLVYSPNEPHFKQVSTKCSKNLKTTPLTTQRLHIGNEKLNLNNIVKIAVSTVSKGIHFTLTLKVKNTDCTVDAFYLKGQNVLRVATNNCPQDSVSKTTVKPKARTLSNAKNISTSIMDKMSGLLGKRHDLRGEFIKPMIRVRSEGPANNKFYADRLFLNNQRKRFESNIVRKNQNKRKHRQFEGANDKSKSKEAIDGGKAEKGTAKNGTIPFKKIGGQINSVRQNVARLLTDFQRLEKNPAASNINGTPSNMNATNLVQLGKKVATYNKKFSRLIPTLQTVANTSKNRQLQSQDLSKKSVDDMVSFGKKMATYTKQFNRLLPDIKKKLGVLNNNKTNKSPHVEKGAAKARNIQRYDSRVPLYGQMLAPNQMLYAKRMSRSVVNEESFPKQNKPNPLNNKETPKKESETVKLARVLSIGREMALYGEKFSSLVPKLTAAAKAANLRIGQPCNDSLVSQPSPLHRLHQLSSSSTTPRPSKFHL